MATTSLAEHRRDSPETVRCAVITVSDTRTLETDRGGSLLVDLLLRGGLQVVDRQIIPDESQRMEDVLARLAGRDDVDAILMTGGTGVSQRDRTFETVTRLLSKPLPGYGELFRYLSFQEIGAAAMLSRATGGLIGRTVLLTMPGSTAAVELAAKRLIVPELAHLVREATR